LLSYSNPESSYSLVDPYLNSQRSGPAVRPLAEWALAATFGSRVISGQPAGGRALRPAAERASQRVPRTGQGRVYEKGIVIVGGGHGGSQIAASLRSDGYAGPLTLVTAERDIPYQRPPLSKAFLKGPHTTCCVVAIETACGTYRTITPP
jgi:hypothetical protein